MIKRIYGKLNSIKNPIIVYSEVTSHCENNCFFCRNKDIKRDGFVSEEVREKILLLVRDNKDVNFKIYFHHLGEPLLYDKLDKYISDINMPNTELWLSTNGVSLNRNRIFDLRRAGLRNIWFTMHYADITEYEEGTRTDNFSKAYENLMNLIEQHRLFKRIHIVTFSKNAEEIEKLIKFKINITLQKERTCIPWVYNEKKAIKERQICISINGDVTFDYKDYNYEHSIGNITHLNSKEIVEKLKGRK